MLRLTAKREHINENANINVPQPYKAKYEDLILRHSKIASTGKNDLGRVKDFLHKIHMMGNKLVYRKQFKISMPINLFLKNL
jgi:hypothetical protein